MEMNLVVADFVVAIFWIDLNALKGGFPIWACQRGSLCC